MAKYTLPTKPTPLVVLLGCTDLGTFDPETDTYRLHVSELHPEATNLIGTVHGGAIGTLLDHAFGMAIYYKYGVNSAVTEEFTIRFKRSLRTKSKIDIICHITSETGQARGDRVTVSGTLKSNGKLIAEMDAVWIRR